MAPWHLSRKIKLEVFLNWISIKCVKFPKKIAPCQGVVVQDENCQGGGAGGGMVQIFFLEFDTFFYIQFKNTSNLIFLGFTVSSESFFQKDFKTSLIFWYIFEKGLMVFGQIFENLAIVG